MPTQCGGIVRRDGTRKQNSEGIPQRCAQKPGAVTLGLVRTLLVQSTAVQQ